MTTRLETPFTPKQGVAHSRCEAPCGDPITIVANPRWDTATWTHDEIKVRDHEPSPELRGCVDATCPGCKYPELGYAFERGEFGCSRCGWVGDERPAS